VKHSKIHKLICSIWNKEELTQQWKESIIVPIHKKGDKTGRNNYREISLLSTAYKILSNFLLSRLTPYANEIIGDHLCEFCRNKTSTTYHILYINQILEKKWEYNWKMHQLLIDFKRTYDSVKREVFYNILLEFGIPKKLVRLIKMFLNCYPSQAKRICPQIRTTKCRKQLYSKIPELRKFIFL
jgi:hypothetical protein